MSIPEVFPNRTNYCPMQLPLATLVVARVLLMQSPRLRNYKPHLCTPAAKLLSSVQVCVCVFVWVCPGSCCNDRSIVSRVLPPTDGACDLYPWCLLFVVAMRQCCVDDMSAAETGEPLYQDTRWL